MLITGPEPYSGVLKGHAELHTFSVLIPAKDEAANLEATVSKVSNLLRARRIPHQILVVNDHSIDESALVLKSLKKQIPELTVVDNQDNTGFGRAIKHGLMHVTGDAVAILMADESDRYEDLVVYWNELQEGVDAVFGSRFIEGGEVIEYPYFKLVLNRLVNWGIRVLFSIDLNDTTNAFKAYRMSAIRSLGPIASNNFNITVELPLKLVINRMSWKVVPTVWTGRSFGNSKLKLKEMGSQYLLTIAYLWFNKLLIK